MNGINNGTCIGTKSPETLVWDEYKLSWIQYWIEVEIVLFCFGSSENWQLTAVKCSSGIRGLGGRGRVHVSWVWSEVGQTRRKKRGCITSQCLRWSGFLRLHAPSEKLPSCQLLHVRQGRCRTSGGGKHPDLKVKGYRHLPITAAWPGDRPEDTGLWCSARYCCSNFKNLKH